MKSVNAYTGLKGIDKVVSNIQRQLKTMEVKSVQGMIEAAMLIQRDMDTTPPMVPVDTRNLQQSWFAHPIKGDKPAILLGFTANYAAFVHEMPDTTNWSKAGSGSKFFEKALKRNAEEIVKLIGKNIQV